MYGTPDNSPKLSAKRPDHKVPEEERQKIITDFERELLVHIMAQLEVRDMIPHKVYENAVNIILRGSF